MVKRYCSRREFILESIKDTGVTTALLALGPRFVLAQNSEHATKKSIERVYDCMKEQNIIPDNFFDNGGPRPLSELSLLKYVNGRFEEVPFQINLSNEDGTLKLDGWNKNVYRAADGTYKRKKHLIEMERNSELRVLSGPHQFLLKIRDTGDRWLEKKLPDGFGKGLEICITDPVNESKSWAYLVDGKKVPKAKVVDYVNYSLEEENGQQIERVKARCYQSMFNISASAANLDYSITKEGGGSGVDIQKKFRSLAKLTIGWSIFKFDTTLKPEDSTEPNLIGYVDGPVEVRRLVYNRIFIPKIPFKIELKDASFLSDSQYNGDYFHFNGKVNIPTELKALIKRIKAELTTDFNENAKGMTFYNSYNPTGVEIDGKMSKEEIELNRDSYDWSLIVGPQGGWANILKFLTPGVKKYFKLYYLDDENYFDEANEKNYGGIYGSTGYEITELPSQNKIDFDTYIFALPNTFTPGDMPQLMNIVYKPLQMEIGRDFAA